MKGFKYFSSIDNTQQMHAADSSHADMFFHRNCHIAGEKYLIFNPQLNIFEVQGVVNVNVSFIQLFPEMKSHNSILNFNNFH